MLRNIATSSARQLTRAARPQPAAPRFFTSSARALVTQGGAAPTTSPSSLGTDRGAGLPADAEEGKQDPTLNKTSQTTNTSSTSAANTQADPAHPRDPAKTANEDGEPHLASHSRGQPGAESNSVGAGGNPLKPSGARGYHSSRVVRGNVREGSKPVEEQSAQHPGKSDLDHLENPSLSEEVVHADREAKDPLPDHHKASEKVDGAASQVQDAASKAQSAAEGAVGQAQGAFKQAADAVKDVFNSATGRKFSTSAVSRGGKPVEEQSAQHPGKSGHDHLDNPSMSEETVHADRSEKDPLPDHHKAGEKKKAKESAGVKDNVSELKKKETDDLPDGEATLRSIGGGN